MSDPTNLIERLEALVHAASAKLEVMRTGWVGALESERLARDELLAVQKELAEVASERSELRAALQSVETSADGEPLLAALEAATIEERGLRAEIALAREARSHHELESAAAEAGVMLARQAHSSAVQARDEELERIGRRDALLDRLDASPLADVRALAAGELSAGADLASAEARVTSDFPAALLAHARARLQEATHAETRPRALMRSVSELVDRRLLATGGADFAVERAGEARDSATEAVSRYAGTAVDRLERARFLLLRVSDPGHAPLTDAQRERIHDSELVDAAEAAAQAEADLMSARAAVDAAGAELEAALLDAVERQVVDPDAEEDVQDANAALESARQQLEDAEEAFTEELASDLDTWEASVPDATWRTLFDLETARRLLEELRDTDPDALAAQLADAEAELLAALLAADARRGSLMELELARGALQRELAAASSSEDHRFAALRGDL